MGWQALKRWDPRVLAIKHPFWSLVVFLALTSLFLWGNVLVKRGGVLDDVILNEDDPFRQMDRYVQSKIEEGFEGKEFIPFIIHFPEGINSTAYLQKICAVTESAKAFFGEEGVISACEIPNYKDTGEGLRSDPYINPALLKDPSFSLQEWKDGVRKDPGVYGLFIGRSFTWAVVIRYLPWNYDEITEFRRTVEFLEGRKIPWYEWFWKRDINPKDPALGVAGWVMGRGIMDQGLNVDMVTLIVLGIFLSLPLFWSALGSLPLALIAVAVMVGGGFLWTRGALGLFDIRERVYCLLAYANVIVQGVSFALHKLEVWRESGEKDKELALRKAMSVDSLIAITGGIAIFGFATLWSFGLKPIRELGIVSALGVAWLLLLSLCFLPALTLLNRKGHVPVPREKSDTRVEKILNGIISFCIRAANWFSSGKKPWAMVNLVCLLFLLIAIAFIQERIISRTNALQYIYATSVEKEAEFLNREGNPGFDFLDFLVEPVAEGAKQKLALRAWEFQKALKTISGTREATSILLFLHKIARESYKKDFPETKEEVEDAFFLIENDLALDIQQKLYFRKDPAGFLPDGVRISVSSGTDDSREWGRIANKALTLADIHFPDLKVSTFGKISLYPRADVYIRQGKMINLFTSQLGVALICAFVIWWRNRKLGDISLSPLWTGLVMSLPLFFATTVMGLLMWGLKIALDMSTAPIGAIAINAAIDFSIYIAFTYQQALKTLSPEEALNKALRTAGLVTIVDCFLNMIAFFPLITSHFLPVRQLGWMMGVMLFTCAIGALILMAALLPHCVRRKEKSCDEKSLHLRLVVNRVLGFIPSLTLFRPHG